SRGRLLDGTGADLPREEGWYAHGLVGPGTVPGDRVPGLLLRQSQGDRYRSRRPTRTPPASRAGPGVAVPGRVRAGQHRRRAAFGRWAGEGRPPGVAGPGERRRGHR